jgi:hypothetical protein
MSLRVARDIAKQQGLPQAPGAFGLPPSLHLGSCRASSSDSGKKDSRAARVTQKASSDMSFCISPLPDCRGPEARTHMDHSGFWAAPAFFIGDVRPSHASDTRSPSCRGVVPKAWCGSKRRTTRRSTNNVGRGCITRQNTLPRPFALLRVTQIIFHYCNEGAAQVIVRSGCLRDGPG